MYSYITKCLLTIVIAAIFSLAFHNIYAQNADKRAAVSIDQKRLVYSCSVNGEALNV